MIFLHGLVVTMSYLVKANFLRTNKQFLDVLMQPTLILLDSQDVAGH